MRRVVYSTRRAKMSLGMSFGNFVTSELPTIVLTAVGTSVAINEREATTIYEKDCESLYLQQLANYYQV